MKLKVASSLRYINIDAVDRPFKFRDSILLKGGDHLDSNLFNEYIVRQLGEVSVRDFINYPYFHLFQETDNPDEIYDKVNLYYSRFNIFTSCLWFAKDNSANVSIVFSSVEEVNNLFTKMKNAGFSNASGKYEETSFSLDDLYIAAKAFEIIAELGSNAPVKGMPEVDKVRPAIVDNIYNYRKYNDNHRIERALSFLQMARSNSYLPLKISLYVATLECLFTTDKSEVTHKVCERAALYLGGNYATKQKNFDILKSNYDIRSGFFHGQIIDKKRDTREKLIEHSTQLDGLIRSILTRVLLFDSAIFLDEVELPLFFKRLLLG